MIRRRPAAADTQLQWCSAACMAQFTRRAAVATSPRLAAAAAAAAAGLMAAVTDDVVACRSCRSCSVTTHCNVLVATLCCAY